jgi:hypothetical protein
MNEPTRGPWRWGDWGATFGTGEWGPNRRTLEYNPTHPGEPNAVIRRHNDGAREVLRLESRDEISDADAELIRRAPELRDALLEMLRDFGGNMDRDRFRELRALAGKPVDED